MFHSISFLNREQSIKLSLQLGKVFKVYTVDEKNNTVSCSIQYLSSIESRVSSLVFNLVKCSKSTLLMRKTILSFMFHSISFLNREQSIKLSLQLVKVFKVYTVDEKNNAVFHVPFNIFPQ